MIKPAERINNVEEYYFSTKLKEIANLISSGKKIINLGIGSPDMPPSEKVIDELINNAKEIKNHGYQSYVGIPDFRKAMAAFYEKYFNVKLNYVDEILPLMGSKEGIMHISLAFLNKDEGVLIPNPGYPTYESVSKLVGANIIKYDLIPEKSWIPDFDEIEKNDLTNVKLMWINYPNMPTGQQASRELFEKAINFGKKHNILICNDNPYSFILNDKQLSILEIENAKDIAIELNSLSKASNMAGWRVGMVCGNSNYINYILRVKSNMDSGMFLPVQKAAIKALELDSSWYNELNSEYEKRKILTYNIFDKLNCSFDKNQKGLFVWARIPDAYKHSKDFSDDVLEKYETFITPGFIFGSNGNNYARISLCANTDTLNEVISRIK